MDRYERAWILGKAAEWLSYALLGFVSALIVAVIKFLLVWFNPLGQGQMVQILEVFLLLGIGIVFLLADLAQGGLIVLLLISPIGLGPVGGFIGAFLSKGKEKRGAVVGGAIGGLFSYILFMGWQ